MEKRRFRINAVVLLTALMFIGTLSQAQYRKHDRRGRGDNQNQGHGRQLGYQNWNDQLELTDEQKGKIEEIKLAASKTSIQRSNKINELEAQLTTLLTGDKIDKAKVNKLIDEIGTLKTDARKERVDVHMKIRDLLTEKQKIIFDQQRSRVNPGRGFYHR
jgi:Spy/CpxP family protein refolding chaperone